MLTKGPKSRNLQTMPRIARIVGVGLPHHIVQRGNNKERVFQDKEDFETYLSLLRKYSEEKEIALGAYCLMSNHVHLLVRPLEDRALPKMMQGVALCYTQYFNKKNRRTGRLWECRYSSTVVDEERYLWAVTSYIENNPVRAGVVKKPDDYKYSSARAHLLGQRDGLLKDTVFDRGELSEYKRLMNKEQNQEMLEEIRGKTRLGKPLGDERFLTVLSEKLGRALDFRSKGRPRKSRE